MSTLHFVYRRGPHLKTPQRITHELAKRLSSKFTLEVHDPGDPGVVEPAAGDILLGHPDRYGEASIFNRSFRQSGWAKRIVFCPFSYGMPLDAAAIDPLVELADHYLALCGPYWTEGMECSPLSHWHYKTMRCDLGIEPADYPRTKFGFNPPRKRRFVYVGNAGPMKGVDYFCDLADANPDLSFHWIGATGDRMRPSGTLRREYARLERRMLSGRIVHHGWADWSNSFCRTLLGQFDFLLACGRSDSNPTTVLEATAIGLLPVATPQCGFPADGWIPNIPLDDVAAASAILHGLNKCPESELLAWHAKADTCMRATYNWDRVTQQVIDCIVAPVPRPPSDPAWLGRKAQNQRQLRGMVRKYRCKQAVEDALHGVETFTRLALKRARLPNAGA